MEIFKLLISKLFDNLIDEIRETNNKKEFISKQLKLHDTRLKLLSFLGRREGSFTVVYPKEGIELTIKRHSSKSYIYEITENLDNKWREV